MSAAPRRGPNPWRRLGVRTRSILIGFALALAVLGAAIASIFARHARVPESADIRVTTGR